MNLFLDIETRSECDLTACGQYVYFEHPSTEITEVGWGIDDGPITTWTPPFGQEMPDEVAAAVHDPAVGLVAHNASFERIGLSSAAGRKLGFPDLSGLSRWTCTAARAAAMGLPRTLEGAAAALGLDVQKDKEGRALMLQMCKPRKPRAIEVTAEWLRQNPGVSDSQPREASTAARAAFKSGALVLPTIWHETPEQFERLGAYCATDVEVERAIFRVLPPLSPFERRTWELTETMNDDGVPVDVKLLNAMIRLIDDATERLNRLISLRTRTPDQVALDELTGQISVGAVPRVTDHGALTRWLIAQGVDDVADTGVGKFIVAAMIDNPEFDPLIREVLVYRRDGGGTSNKKYLAIARRLSADGCIHGVLVYCGAAMNKRWSSRGAQLQNLARPGQVKDERGNPMDSLNMVRDILAGATCDEIEAIWGPPLVVAAECLRPLFVA